MTYKIEKILIWKAVRRGDVIIDSQGYCHVLHQDERKEQTLHRRVAEQLLGRKLAAAEHVHHVDKNTLNNHPSNLLVLSPSAHRQLHSAISQNGDVDQREWLTEKALSFIDLSKFSIPSELLVILELPPKTLIASLEEERAAAEEKRRIKKLETQRRNRLAGIEKAKRTRMKNRRERARAKVA